MLDTSSPGKPWYKRDWFGEYWKWRRDTTKSVPEAHKQDTQYVTESVSNYSSMSGCDITVLFNSPVDGKLLKVANAITLTVSTYREVIPVRALSCVGVRGYTRGGRTVAGSILITNVYADALTIMCEQLASAVSPHDADSAAKDHSRFLADQLPKFDIHLSISNEHGIRKRRHIFGVRLLTEGSTYSVEDILVENQYSYVAESATPEIRVEAAEHDLNSHKLVDGGTGNSSAESSPQSSFSYLATKYKSMMMNRNPYM